MKNELSAAPTWLIHGEVRILHFRLNHFDDPIFHIEARRTMKMEAAAWERLSAFQPLPRFGDHDVCRVRSGHVFGALVSELAHIDIAKEMFP